MKKIIIGLILINFIVCNLLFAQDTATVPVTLVIQNVTIDGGTVYVSLFRSKAAFTNDNPDMIFNFPASSETIETVISIPQGELVIGIYQDTNNNGRLDLSGIWGTPTEPYGRINWNGRGFPGGYDRVKVNIRNAQTITIGLFIF